MNKRKLEIVYRFVTGGLSYYLRALIVRIFVKDPERRIKRLMRIHDWLMRHYEVTLVATVDTNSKMVTLAYVPKENV